MKKPASGVKDHKWKPKKEGTEGEALVKAVANSTKQQALKKKQAAQDAYQKNIDYDTARHAAKTRKHEEIEVEEMSPLMQATIAELSKKTLGSYVKKASVDKSNATLDLGISQGPKQTRADVVKHAGKAIKRQKGIDKAVDKLSKESNEVDAGERDLGSDEYANYVKTLTPGEKAETDVHSRDARKAEVKAKKADKKQKEENAQKQRQATVVDEGGAYGSDAAADRGAKRLGLTPDRIVSRTVTKTKDGGHLGKTVYKKNPTLLKKLKGEGNKIDMPMHELLGIPFTLQLL
jgi:hypothetical protein